jgi:hypothetical protein
LSSNGCCDFGRDSPKFQARIWQTWQETTLAPAIAKFAFKIFRNSAKNVVTRSNPAAVLKRDGSCRKLGTLGTARKLIAADVNWLETVHGD